VLNLGLTESNRRGAERTENEHGGCRFKGAGICIELRQKAKRTLSPNKCVHINVIHKTPRYGLPI